MKLDLNRLEEKLDTSLDNETSESLTNWLKKKRDNMEQTPKEKAKELFDKYQLAGSQWYVDTTKNYALIAVDEILESQPRYPSEVDWDDCGATHQYYYEAQREEAGKYWQEVKQEINKL